MAARTGDGYGAMVERGEGGALRDQGDPGLAEGGGPFAQALHAVEEGGKVDEEGLGGLQAARPW